MYERKMTVTVVTNRYLDYHQWEEMQRKVAAALNLVNPNPMEVTPGGGYFLVNGGTGDPLGISGLPEYLDGETTHLCPPGGEYETTCCHQDIRELPDTDRLSLIPAMVTCRG